eukprot:1184804-Prorocentrum_minimum.AAC.3
MRELGQVLHGEQDVWSRAAGYPQQLAKKSSKGELGVHLGVLLVSSQHNIELSGSAPSRPHAFMHV